MSIDSPLLRPLASAAAGLAALVLAASALGWGATAEIALGSAAVIAAASVARPRLSDSIALCYLAPLAALLAIPDPRIAALVSGAAAAVALFVILSDPAPISAGATVLLLASWTFALRFAAADGLPLGEAVLVSAGGAVLAFSLRKEGSPRVLPPPALALALLSVALTPAAPAEAVLWPAMLGAVVFAARSRSWLYGALAVAAAAIAGKWMILPAVVLLLVPLLGAARSGSPLWMVLPAVGRVWPALLLHATAWPVWRSAGLSGRIAALVLLAGALIIDRPWVAATWIFASLLVLAIESAGDEKPRAAAMGFAAAAVLPVLGLGWGGALPGVFPLPSTLTLILLLAAAAASVSAGWRVRAVVPVTALLALIVVTARSDRAAGSFERVGQELAPGATVTLRTSGSRISIELRGAHLSGVSPAQQIGTIEYLTSSGEGGRRALHARDAADWGGARVSQVFSTRGESPLRMRPLRSLGRGAFAEGGGEVELAAPGGIELIRLKLDENLPREVRVVVEGVRSWTR